MLIKQGATDQQQRTKINPAKSADIAEADEAKEQDAVHDLGEAETRGNPIFDHHGMEADPLIEFVVLNRIDQIKSADPKNDAQS